MLRKPLTVGTLLLCALFALASLAEAGNKKIMSTRAATAVAERAIVESIYGLKVRSSEKVEDMIAASFEGKTETKTAAEIVGIKIEETTYDPVKDIAKAIASITLDSFTNIDGQEMNLGNRTFRRVGFGTSTPSQAGPLKALRAAEIDGYKQIAKRIVGFTLESQTTVENFILTSDLIKSKVLATIYLTEVTDYGWDETGDAFIKMKIDPKDVSQILGQNVISETEVIEVEGLGAQKDDFSTANTAAAAKKKK